jgi:predicted DNA-binding transcriptional regulator YafY
MANTSSRTLRLLALLQTHRFWTGPELAGRLGVSARTLRRDVDRLRELGYPVHARRGADGGYQLAAGAALPPLVVDDEEAVALAVGLQAAAQGAVAGVEEAAVRALAKVVQVMPRPLRRRMDALRTMTVPAVRGAGAALDAGTLDAETLTVLAQACRDSERVEFGYTARGGDRTDRSVEPYRLVTLGRRWYLVAYDLDRHDWRSFRLDRITAPHRTGARFRVRALPAADAAAFVRAGIEAVPAPHAVEAVVHAPADAVREVLGRWASVAEIDGERCLVRMSVDDLDWPALALGAVGAEFEVRSPPDLVAHLREWAERFGRATGGAVAGHPHPRDAGTGTGEL